MMPAYSVNSATVFVQRPGEFPEEYERFAEHEQAESCRSMLKRDEPFWRVWVG
jgi:hypothetical protein